MYIDFNTRFPKTTRQPKTTKPKILKKLPLRVVVTFDGFFNRGGVGDGHFVESTSGVEIRYFLFYTTVGTSQGQEIQ